eukprot:9162457-Karenia_brevis.AAC.1
MTYRQLLHKREGEYDVEKLRRLGDINRLLIHGQIIELIQRLTEQPQLILNLDVHGNRQNPVEIPRIRTFNRATQVSQGK